METKQKKVVGILGDSSPGRFRFLFQALAELYPLRFRNITALDDSQLDGCLCLNGDSVSALAACSRGVPSFVVLDQTLPKDGASTGQIQFGQSTLLEECLRNQVMQDNEALLAGPLPQSPQDEVLASINGIPVWLHRQVAGCTCQFVSLSLPPLSEHGFLFEYFKRERFFRLLPLLNFLRQVVREVDWKSPPVPACFVFDDPSLYWRSYGYLNFQALGEHAKKHGYCAAIGTIPIDTWWVNRNVVSTFQSYRPQLSLLIHGNNHTRMEFVSKGNDVSMLAPAAQAIRRIERIEQRFGLPVTRIMEMPHGVWCQPVFKHLLDLGYEAAFATTGLLVENNPGSYFPRDVGLHRAEILGGGLPVLPRIKMTPLWKNDILLSAFLRQPIVIAGHHNDAADGLKLLEKIASVVNGLPGVKWTLLGDLLRGNYLWQTEGDQLILRMRSRKHSIQIPQGIRTLRVERSWVSEHNEELHITCDSKRLLWGSSPPLSDPVSVSAGDLLDISSIATTAHSARSVAAPPFKVWPIVRKIMMETRDRLMPYVAMRRPPSE